MLSMVDSGAQKTRSLCANMKKGLLRIRARRSCWDGHDIFDYVCQSPVSVPAIMRQL